MPEDHDLTVALVEMAIGIDVGNDLTAEAAIRAASIWVQAAIVLKLTGDKNEVRKLLAPGESDTVPLKGPWLDVQVLRGNVRTLADLFGAPAG
jgi:hypothetical protein